MVDALWFVGCLVLESHEGLGDVKHQDMDPAAVIVPIHVHDEEVRSIPVNGTFIVFIENFREMLGMLPPDVLDDRSE
jgi:hypothetical protein